MATVTMTTTLHPAPTPSHHLRLSPTPSRKRNHQTVAAVTNVASQANTTDGSRQPKLRITASQKQALIDNLQLEITERARNLRVQYSLQATDLRSRIERRINRIPIALRKVKMGELMAKHAEQKNQSSASSEQGEQVHEQPQQPQQQEPTQPTQNQIRAPAPAGVPRIRKIVPSGSASGSGAGSGVNRNGANSVRKVSKRHLSPEKDVLGPGNGGHQHNGSGSNPTRIVKKKKANNPSAAVIPSPSQPQTQLPPQTPADDKENEPYIEAITIKAQAPANADSPLKNPKRRNSPTQLPVPRLPVPRLENASQQQNTPINESRVLTPKSNNQGTVRASPLKKINLVISPTKKPVPPPLHSATLAVRGANKESNAAKARPATAMGFASGTPALKNGTIYTDRESDDESVRPPSSSAQTLRYGRPPSRANNNTPASRFGSAVKNTASFYGGGAQGKYSTVSATPSRTAKTVGYSAISGTKHRRPALPQMSSNDTVGSVGSQQGVRSGVQSSVRGTAQTGAGTVRKNAGSSRPTTAMGSYGTTVPGSVKKVVRKKAAA
ncbi:hypothetical protein KEM56_005534 [Ascosphaera pollenicola]|nr:hypothetical protein KEM56_005534 [Ascosphaera pollenicola]